MQHVNLPSQVLLLTWDEFKAEVQEAVRNYAKEAAISTKDGLKKYLRRAQTDTAAKYWAAVLVLLDVVQLLQSVSIKLRENVVSLPKSIPYFERTEGVH